MAGISIKFFIDTRKFLIQIYCLYVTRNIGFIVICLFQYDICRKDFLCFGAFDFLSSLIYSICTVQNATVLFALRPLIAFVYSCRVESLTKFLRSKACLMNSLRLIFLS